MQIKTPFQAIIAKASLYLTKKERQSVIKLSYDQQQMLFHLLLII